MKVSQVTINTLALEIDESTGKETTFKPILATGTIREKSKFSARDTAIIEELKTFSIGTRKTAHDIVANVNRKHGKAFYTYNELATEREVLTLARYLQAEKIGFTTKENKKNETVFTRIDWTAFESLNIVLDVKTIAEQAKELAERKAVKASKAEGEKRALLTATLAEHGYTETEIVAILQVQKIQKQAKKTA